MNECYFGGVEEETGTPAAVLAGAFFAGVFVVGDDGMAEILEMDPDLVSPASGREQF